MISANTLFHFTKSLDNIRNILTNNFTPRYSLEKLNFIPKVEMEIGIPMVCFCDIPLSQVTNHINIYGTYAIGLKKEWALANSISPIFYLYNESRTSYLLNQLFKTSVRFDRIVALHEEELKAKASREIFELLYHCKAYKGSMWRDGVLINDITFYDEREWRYVPSLDSLESINPKLLINKEEYDNKQMKENFDNSLFSFKIEFTPNDIKYIIVEKELERLEVVNLIEEIKGGKFEPNDLRVLSSKVLTVEQIKDDF